MIKVSHSQTGVRDRADYIASKVKQAGKLLCRDMELPITEEDMYTPDLRKYKRRTAGVQNSEVRRVLNDFFTKYGEFYINLNRGVIQDYQEG